MVLRHIIDSVLPPRCPFTGELVAVNGTVSAPAWSALSFIAEPVCSRCGLPFDFAMPGGAGDHACASCLSGPPEFSSARAALVYNDASRDLILAFKHGDRLETVTVMTPWLARAGAPFWESCDLLVPVPLHRWRLLRRRYNQAGLLGAALGRNLKIPFCADAMLRVRPTPTQGHLNAAERRKNVRRAFAVNPRRLETVRGKNIVLVDDVYTTGATVRECAAALLAAGAADVNVLTVARVVRPSRF